MKTSKSSFWFQCERFITITKVTADGYLYFLFMLSIYILVQSESSKASFIHRRLPRGLSNCPSADTQLDLTKRNITQLQTSDFSCFLDLKFLNLSYNSIEELDCSVFQFNPSLEYLDISNNRLHTIQCQSLQYIKNIKHLDLSYNNFKQMHFCKEFTALSQLKHLGLSAEQIQTNSFLNIAPMQLEYVFLGMEDLTEYENGSLQFLNTNKLLINLPTNLNLASSYLLSDALNTSTTLEVSGAQCDVHCDYFTKSFSTITKNSKVVNLIISNGAMPGNEIFKIMPPIWDSSIEHLYIKIFRLQNELKYVKMDFLHHSIKSLTVEDLTNEVVSFRDTHPLQMFAEMLVENITFSRAELYFFFCPPAPSIFRVINLPSNRLTDDIFQNCANLKELELLNLQNNKLEQMSKISSMTLTMPNLKHLDLSRNGLHIDNEKQCKWMDSLVFLNLSESGLTNSVFGCLPINLQILDLSKNQISSIPIEVKNFVSLKELHLASNRLTDIPDCHNIGNNLGVLKVDENLINLPSKEFLQNCEYVKYLSAGKNPFQCNCDLREFVKMGVMFPKRLIGWPESYKCADPENLRGIFLQDFYLPEISCNISMLLGVVLGTIFILSIIVVSACFYFDVPWYIRMLFRWFRTKHRLRNVNQQDIQNDKLFHAFISYSQEDSDWVKNMLLPNLERKDGSIKICHHERHFIPGKAIIENIIDCIEKSFKSIFVLSPNFIQSDWCHYELYFAQHTLFGKNSNNLILILLDPIPQYLIPNKYNKLRSIMKHRTYLEWPKEKGKHALFWANLREAIHVNLSIKEEDMADPEVRT
ncbi:hypothetical protein XENTR_v10000463 [Xenopus tropicalis]|uniref:Toll-like receptor 1 n=2 Tax=Xenopus tropicalis TaxID=8364 RepID=A0A8J0T487_XENTR|nr:toll-like receptor 1 [Xenopus tropicalis]KAE8629376.1 hypothetical protein XENTR_v10000463 [Xenopus tropicalis]